MLSHSAVFKPLGGLYVKLVKKYHFEKSAKYQPVIVYLRRKFKGGGIF